MDEILISVIVITYQHEKYIKNAMDSILSQNIDFPIEIIVADDCSKDGTQDILLEYRRQHKEKIKLILRNRNIGPTRNVYSAYKKAVGKYIICLEGDDYWTDNDKLKKQVEFLEKHPEMVGVFHRCHVIDAHDQVCRISYEDMYTTKSVYTMEDFEKGKLPGHTGTFMYRNFFKDERNRADIIYKLHWLVGDQTIYCILLTMGNFSFMEDDMSVYRIVEKKGGTSASSIAKNNNLSFSMWKYYCDLETCIYAIYHKRISLEVQRKKQIKAAKERFLISLMRKDLVILLKIAFFDMMYTFFNKWRNMKKTIR